MDNNYIIDIAKKFKIEGNPISAKKCNSGHINRTYEIVCKLNNNELKRYILQYINTDVFSNLSKLMLNIKNLTKYLSEKDIITISLIDTIDDNIYSIYDNNWRMENFIENTKSYLETTDVDLLFELGRIIGDFQKELNKFEVNELYEIIPKFHNTPNRIIQLKKAILDKENIKIRKDRLNLSKDIINFVTENQRIQKANIIVKKLENGEIPIRVTHNDTKLSNVLFSKDTNKAVCLIDWDTIMPGAIAYDYGEGVRTSISSSKEDEEDLSKVHIDMNRFEAYTKGFCMEVKDIITKEEFDTLIIGIWMMIYENAIRFLTDYLNGDIYFEIDKNIKNHNLIRAKSQIQLLKQVEEREEELRNILKKYI